MYYVSPFEVFDLVLGVLALLWVLGLVVDFYLQVGVLNRVLRESRAELELEGLRFGDSAFTG